MPPILVICPNPAIDRTAIVHGYRLGAIHRPERVISLPGGKGLNAARAIRRLGGEVLVGAILAGNAGRWMVEAANQEGIPIQAVWVEGETRLCYNVYDPTQRQMSEVYEKGVPIQTANWQAFETLTQNLISGAAWVILSGSLPEGAPVDGYARLIEQAKARGVRTLLDTHGSCLLPALAAHPMGVKINTEEAAELLEISHQELAESVPNATRAASRICSQFALEFVIVSMGKQGAVACHTEGHWLVSPPSIETGCATGSGDCMLGGLAFALERGTSFTVALSLGAAAGAANALQPGAGNFEQQQVDALLPQIQCTPLPEPN
jgi:tagatose 6-phosphate kinase